MPGEYPPEYRGGGLANWFRKQQGIDGIAKNVPQNSAGGMLSDNLSAIRKWLDKTTISGEIPYTDIGGKMGLGEMFMGQAPELVEDASWGIPPYKKTGHGYQLDPRVADVLGLPLPYAGGTQIAKVLAKKGIEKMIPNKSDLAPESMSRRKFSKNALGTGLATGAAVGGGLAGKAVVKNIMDAVPVARPAAVAAARVTFGNPMAFKLAALLRSGADVFDPYEALKAFKDGGSKGLTRHFEGDFHMEYPDLDDFDVDPDEVKKILEQTTNTFDNMSYPKRDYTGIYDKDVNPYFIEELETNLKSYKQNFDQSNFSGIIDSFDADMSEFLGRGYDPDEIIAFYEKSGNLSNALKARIDKIKIDPDAYKLELDDLDVFNELENATVGNPDKQEFYFGY